MDRKVIVNGTGTIGGPVLRRLLDGNLQRALGIDEVIYRKFTPNPKHVGMMWRFHKAGAKLAVEKKKRKEFCKILELLKMIGPDEVFEPDYDYEDILHQAAAIIDCTKDGEGKRARETTYDILPKNIVVIAQGSETDFGFPYALGHNDDALERFLGRYVWVLSCNGHLIVAVVNALTSGFLKEEVENITKIRFSLDRRGADVVNENITTTSELGAAGKGRYGTHQGTDAAKLLETVGVAGLDMHTTTDKDPQPFMHKTEVTVEFRKPVSAEEVIHRFCENKFTGVTLHTKIGSVYTEGKDWGETGRINVQAVLSIPTVELVRPCEVKFKCLTPQDGNAVSSSIAALIRFLRPDAWRSVVEEHLIPPLKKFQIV